MNFLPAVTISPEPRKLDSGDGHTYEHQLRSPTSVSDAKMHVPSTLLSQMSSLRHSIDSTPSPRREFEMPVRTVDSYENRTVHDFDKRKDLSDNTNSTRDNTYYGEEETYNLKDGDDLLQSRPHSLRISEGRPPNGALVDPVSSYHVYRSRVPDDSEGDTKVGRIAPQRTGLPTAMTSLSGDSAHSNKPKDTQLCETLGSPINSVSPHSANIKDSYYPSDAAITVREVNSPNVSLQQKRSQEALKVTIVYTPSPTQVLTGSTVYNEKSNDIPISSLTERYTISKTDIQQYIEDNVSHSFEAPTDYSTKEGVYLNSLKTEVQRQHQSITNCIQEFEVADIPPQATAYNCHSKIYNSSEYSSDYTDIGQLSDPQYSYDKDHRDRDVGAYRSNHRKELPDYRNNLRLEKGSSKSKKSTTSHRYHYPHSNTKGKALGHVELANLMFEGNQKLLLMKAFTQWHGYMWARRLKLRNEMPDAINIKNIELQQRWKSKRDSKEISDKTSDYSGNISSKASSENVYEVGLSYKKKKVQKRNLAYSDQNKIKRDINNTDKGKIFEFNINNESNKESFYQGKGQNNIWLVEVAKSHHKRDIEASSSESNSSQDVSKSKTLERNKSTIKEKYNVTNKNEIHNNRKSKSRDTEKWICNVCGLDLVSHVRGVADHSFIPNNNGTHSQKKNTDRLGTNGGENGAIPTHCRDDRSMEGVLLKPKHATSSIKIPTEVYKANELLTNKYNYLDSYQYDEECLGSNYLLYLLDEEERIRESSHTIPEKEKYNHFTANWRASGMVDEKSGGYFKTINRVGVRSPTTIPKGPVLRSAQRVLERMGSAGVNCPHSNPQDRATSGAGGHYCDACFVAYQDYLMKGCPEQLTALSHYRGGRGTRNNPRYGPTTFVRENSTPHSIGAIDKRRGRVCYDKKLHMTCDEDNRVHHFPSTRSCIPSIPENPYLHGDYTGPQSSKYLKKDRENNNGVFLDTADLLSAPKAAQQYTQRPTVHISPRYNESSIDGLFSPREANQVNTSIAIKSGRIGPNGGATSMKEIISSGKSTLGEEGNLLRHFSSAPPQHHNPLTRNSHAVSSAPTDRLSVDSFTSAEAAMVYDMLKGIAKEGQRIHAERKEKRQKKVNGRELAEYDADLFIGGFDARHDKRLENALGEIDPNQGKKYTERQDKCHRHHTLSSAEFDEDEKRLKRMLKKYIRQNASKFSQSRD